MPGALRDGVLSRRKRTRGTLLWMLSTKMLPAVGVLVPIYLIAKTPACSTRAPSLVIIYVLSNLPIGVWMLFTFFRETPKDIIEASRIDGANVRQVILQVLLPLVAPGIASTALLSIILCWNEAFWSLNLSAHDAAPLTAFIASLLRAARPVLGQALRRLDAGDRADPRSSAGSARRQLVRGLTFGAVK